MSQPQSRAMRPLLQCMVVVAVCLMSLPGASAGLWGKGSSISDEPPHVEDCITCKECIQDGPTPFPAADMGMSLLDTKTAEQLLLKQVDLPRRKLNCTICRGCNVKLDSMGNQVVDMGNGVKVRRNGQGNNSHSRLYWATIQQSPAEGGGYIAKFECDPEAVKPDGWAPCDGRAEEFHRLLKVQLGLQKIAEDCGTVDVYVRTWFAPVITTIPETGVPLRGHAMFMEPAPGVKMGRFDWTVPVVAKPILQKLNSSKIVSAAFMDLLTRQCDRHSGNVFMNTDGNIAVIDNEQQLGLMTAPNSTCSYDSIFLPGSRYHVNAYYAYKIMANVVEKKGGRRLQASTTKPGCDNVQMPPTAVLDYRCHVKGGAIGNWNYPPQAKHCLQRIATTPAEELRARYSLLDTPMADLLKQRASDMLEYGFEWALKNSAPTNKGIFYGRDLPPCCALKWPEGSNLSQEDAFPVCATCWKGESCAAVRRARRQS